jgi:membrane associated rhomboid family serine protease
MLIIPLEKSIDWRKPPVVTFLLILINSIVLVYSNHHDENILANSLSYYTSSELPKLELPRYLTTQPEFTEDISNEELTSQIENGKVEQEALSFLLFSMESDVDFMKKLHQDQVITKQDEAYPSWKTTRTQFEAIQESAIISRFGFTPSKHKPITFLTHQFLHGGYDHLFGNMLFLFLIGFTLETALGSWLYLACYLLSGLGAVTLYWQLYSTSETVLVGASGAIAGLMGLYAGVFGFRWIRFFYSLLFYFDYIKAPALIMLPLWVANEFYQLYFTEGSNVAYMAHVGGLLTGGIISFALKKYFAKQVDTQYLDAALLHEEKAKQVEQGMHLLRELKIPQAKVVFANLHHNYRDDPEILMHYFKTVKHTPELNEYLSVVTTIFEKSHRYSIGQIANLFKDYIKVRELKQLPTQLLIKLALLFSKNDNPADAEIILTHLLQRPTDVTDLDHALVALAAAWQRLGNQGKHKLCLNLLVEHFPSQSAGINARKVLAALQG